MTGAIMNQKSIGLQPTRERITLGHGTAFDSLCHLIVAYLWRRQFMMSFLPWRCNQEESIQTGESHRELILIPLNALFLMTTFGHLQSSIDGAETVLTTRQAWDETLLIHQFKYLDRH